MPRPVTQPICGGDLLDYDHEREAEQKVHDSP